MLLDGRPADGRLVWSLVRSETRRLDGLAAVLRRRQTIERLVRLSNALPVGRKSADGSRWLANQYNVRLAYLMWPTRQEAECALTISRIETVGTYEHRVGYGFTWNQPDNGKAYGFGQALPGSKMAPFGSDWRTNPATQMLWMDHYAKERYGGICPAATYRVTHANW